MPIKKTSKEEIVITCKEVFHLRGYFNTSMNDLASACGLLKGSFYYYFASKEEIMKAALAHSHLLLKEKVLSIAYQEEIAAHERLSAVVGLILEQVISFKSCLFGNTALETSMVVEDFQVILQNIFTDILDALEKIYSAKMDGDLAKKKSMQTVQQMQGAVMLMKVFGNTDLLQECRKSIIEEF